MSALRVTLLGLIVAWILFVAGFHVAMSPTYDDRAGLGDLNPATYFFFGAIAALGLAGLYTKRKAQSQLLAGDPVARAVYGHGFGALIVASVAAGLAVVSIFFSLVNTEPASIGVRILNLYLPIVLFTALLVALLLSGFVFGGRVPVPHPVHPVAPDRPGPSPSDTRSVAWAYSIPIIAGALAAILAGIVYDATRTSLNVWMWLLILTIIAAGIVLGTHFSSKEPSAAGAVGLNTGWTIAFVIVAGAMAFGYGASSTDQLHLNANLSIDAFPADSGWQLDVSGSGLAPDSELTLTVDPSGTRIQTYPVDSDGWVYEERAFPADLPAGEHRLTLRGTTADGGELEAILKVTTDGSSDVMLTGQSHSFDEYSATLPVSWGWFGSKVLPAFLMLLVVTALIDVTLVLRSRRWEVPRS